MKTPNYLALNKGGTPARLTLLRSAALRHNETRPSVQTWRDARDWTFKNWEAAYCVLSPGMNGNNSIWYDHTGGYFRNERYADECDDVRIDHTGWFCDVHENGKARGIVASLPHGRFIAGYELSDNDERVYFDSVHDNERDAALMADEHARVVGESSMEFSYKFEEAQKLESEIDDSFSRLRECLVLRHTACMSYVRGEISELITTIRGNRDKLTSDYAGVL